MTGVEFLPFIPGAVDDLGDEHGLSWGARSMLRWLAETAHRQTGVLAPVTVKAIEEATRCSWRSAKRLLDELEGAGAIEAVLPKGHDGRIVISGDWHDRIVWRKGARNRGSTHGNRGSTRRNRASAIGNRASAIRNRASAQANRANGDREREEPESSSNSLSVGARAGGSAKAAPPAGADVVPSLHPMPPNLVALVERIADTRADDDRTEWLAQFDGWRNGAGSNWAEVDDYLDTLFGAITDRLGDLDPYGRDGGWGGAFYDQLPFSGDQVNVDDGGRAARRVCDEVLDFLDGRGPRPAWLPADDDEEAH
jgi:hypothetical protein